MTLAKVLGVILILFIAVSVYAVYLALKKKGSLEKYKELEKGMSVEQMVAIMGKDFTTVNDDDKTVYTWQANVSKNYSGLFKVVVNVKDGKIAKVMNYSK